MFESLKKKFKGTIGKISDDVASDEKLESSEAETDKSAEVSKKTEEISKDESVEKPVDQNLEESDNKDEAKKSGFMGFLRGNKSSEENISDNVTPDSELSETMEADSTTNSSDEVIEETDKDDKSGILSFVRNKTISEKDIEDTLFELEM